MYKTGDLNPRKFVYVWLKNRVFHAVIQTACMKMVFQNFSCEISQIEAHCLKAIKVSTNGLNKWNVNETTTATFV